MFSSCKYVVLRNEEQDGNDLYITENIFLFPSRIVHKSVATRMNGTPVSAGFVFMDKNGKMYCAGESSTLRLTSRAEDTILLRSMIQ